MVVFSVQGEKKQFSQADIADGSLAPSFGDEKLMRAVLEHDQEMLEQGEMIAEGTSHNISGFAVDIFFEKLTQNYTLARQLYGDRLIRLITGHMPQYIERNLHIPEFKKELKAQIARRIERMRAQEVLDAEGNITDKGLELAALVLYAQELDALLPRGFSGMRQQKCIAHYGEQSMPRAYRQGDRYKDIAIRRSVRVAIRHQHEIMEPDDLRTAPREARGLVQIIYGIDASASMRGKKIETAKKSGVALAYKAIERKDHVGIVVFGSQVKAAVEPTDDFGRILRALVRIRASMQTDFTKLIARATQLFTLDGSTKHLLILTDALPTVGEDPKRETLRAVSLARSRGITISVVGINLDEEGLRLAKQVTALGEGRLYTASSLENVNRLVLEDYFAAVSA